jgi:dienelactone hydrolase
MDKEHSVIVVPGLGDKVRGIQLATSRWQRYGLMPIVHSVGWGNRESEFQPKLDELLNLIDTLSSNNQKVSVVGTSAGGSAAINSFYERNTKIHRAVNVCGRLKVGPTKGLRSFHSKTASCPAFAQSVELCQSHIGELSLVDRQRIMTIHALFGDELVPSETTIIEGANNTFIPTSEHMFSIAMALTVFSKPLIDFLTE